MPDTFTIEENIESNALSIVLQGADMPYALPRSSPGFESGGPVAHEKIYLPGRTTPIFQVKQAQERPLVIKGAFRDHLYVRDGGDPGVLHARAMRDAVERIRKRANIVRITWTDEQRLGLLVDAQFGEESKYEISYELTFEISTGVLDRLGSANEDGQRRDVKTVDTVAALRTQLAEQQALLDALAARAVNTATVAEIASALALADVALGQLADNASSLDATPAAQIATATARVYTTAQSVQSALTTAASLIAAQSAVDVVPLGLAPDVAAWFAFQYSSIDALDSMLADTQQLRADVRARTRSAVRLYVVRPGDTLESIARAELGDASRAGDLGIRPSDLRAGLVLRLPEAA